MKKTPSWFIPLKEQKIADVYVKYTHMEAEKNRLRMALKALMKATSCTTYPDDHPIHFAFGLAKDALMQSPDVQQQTTGDK